MKEKLDINIVREKVLEVINQQPGISLNGLNAAIGEVSPLRLFKFQYIYTAVRQLRDENVVKVDERVKKNQGIFATGVDMGEAPVAPVRAKTERVKEVKGGRSKHDAGNFRYIIQKHVEGAWRDTDSTDDVEESEIWRKQYQRLVPGWKYRVWDKVNAVAMSN